MAPMANDKPGEEWGPTPVTGDARAVTPLEIQQKEFAVARFGGYKMRDVDEFLDELTESVSALVAENERLRRQAGADPVVGSPDLDDVSRQADEIIQRARDEASRIVAEANEQAASIAGTLAAEGAAAGSAAEAEAVQAFLAQEREFLQSLATLVQGHVVSVKGMARQAPKPSTPTAEPSTPTEASEPEASQPETDAEVTQVMSEPDEPIRIDEPQPTRATSKKGENGDDSLRELFWGEEG